MTDCHWFAILFIF